MMNHDKRTITKLVFEQLKNNPDNSWKDTPLDKLMFQWWVTGRSGTSMALTQEGNLAFRTAEIKHYDFGLDDWLVSLKESGTSPRQAQQIINKNVTSPYYLRASHSRAYPNPYSAAIRIYDEKLAMMITLYGSFGHYLDSLKNG